MDKSQTDSFSQMLDGEEADRQPETEEDYEGGTLDEMQFASNGEAGDEMQMPELTDATRMDQEMSKLFVNADEFGGEGMPYQEDEELYPPYADPNYRMPDEIEVRVDGPEGDYYFPVKVEKSITRKLYIGGYRNKRTGAIYHHSSSQTPTENKKSFIDNGHLRTRETQTYETRTVSIQSYREFGTQMERVDCYVDNSRDRELVSKTYYTSSELEAAKRVSAIEVQRNWRGHVARARAAHLKVHIATRERKEFEDRFGT